MHLGLAQYNNNSSVTFSCDTVIYMIDDFLQSASIYCIYVFLDLKRSLFVMLVLYKYQLGADHLIQGRGAVVFL